MTDSATLHYGESSSPFSRSSHEGRTRQIRRSHRRRLCRLRDRYAGWSGRTFTLIQYWRSFEQLERFARNRDDPHLDAWRRFNQRVGASGDVGVFHETYQVAAGAYEALYSNMPVVGLAAAGTHLPVGHRGQTARQRIQAED